MVLVAATSLHAFDIDTGTNQLKVKFPQRSIHSLTLASNRVVMILGPDFRNPDSQWIHELVIVEVSKIIARRPLKYGAQLRTCGESGLVYATDPAYSFPCHLFPLHLPRTGSMPNELCLGGCRRLRAG